MDHGRPPTLQIPPVPPRVRAQQLQIESGRAVVARESLFIYTTTMSGRDIKARLSDMRELGLVGKRGEMGLLGDGLFEHDLLC